MILRSTSMVLSCDTARIAGGVRHDQTRDFEVGT